MTMFQSPSMSLPHSIHGVIRSQRLLSLSRKPWLNCFVTSNLYTGTEQPHLTDDLEVVGYERRESDFELEVRSSWHAKKVASWRESCGRLRGKDSIVVRCNAS